MTYKRMHGGERSASRAAAELGRRRWDGVPAQVRSRLLQRAAEARWARRTREERVEIMRAVARGRRRRQPSNGSEAGDAQRQRTPVTSPESGRTNFVDALRAPDGRSLRTRSAGRLEGSPTNSSLRAKAEHPTATRRRDEAVAAPQLDSQIGVTARRQREGTRKAKKTPAQIATEIKARTLSRQAPLDLPPGATD
jgi:hypothetical protein